MNEKTLKVTVTDIIEETHNVKTYTLVPVKEKKLVFLPGQFVNLYVNTGELVKRSYSIASSPLERNSIRLTIEKVPGGKLTPYLHDTVKTGDVLDMSYPMGSFTYSEEDKSIVLMAAGTGIVPFMSMMDYCTQKNLDTKITLFYSCKTPEDILFRRRLKELQADYQNIKVCLTLTRDPEWKGHCGRIDRRFIAGNVNRITESTFYLCGSLEFVRAMAGMLKEMGVDRKKIKRDVWI